MTVDENYRSIRVGFALLKFILNAFKQVKFYASIMEYPVENKSSKRLFKNNGFVLSPKIYTANLYDEGKKYAKTDPIFGRSNPPRR